MKIRSKPARRRRPAVEALEGRALLAHLAIQPVGNTVDANVVLGTTGFLGTQALGSSDVSKPDVAQVSLSNPSIPSLRDTGMSGVDYATGLTPSSTTKVGLYNNFSLGMNVQSGSAEIRTVASQGSGNRYLAVTVKPDGTERGYEAVTVTLAGTFTPAHSTNGTTGTNSYAISFEPYAGASSTTLFGGTDRSTSSWSAASVTKTVTFPATVGQTFYVSMDLVTSTGDYKYDGALELDMKAIDGSQGGGAWKRAAPSDDYDGDGKTDVAVYRPGTSTFYARESSGGALEDQFGWPGHDQTLVGDYDGDGKTDVGVYRHDNSTFYIQLSSGGSLDDQFGWPGHDEPITGDYDGDGKVDVAVFRPDTATFYAQLSSGGTLVQQYGWPGHDEPTIGDFDGDGKTDVGVYRPDTSTFYARESSGGALEDQYGWPGHDQPLVGDYDGDGKTDVAVYRPDTSTFYAQGSTEGPIVQQYGWPEHDEPMAGDYDGDGKTDIAVFRPDTSTFFGWLTGGGVLNLQFGWPGHDQPLSGKTTGGGSGGQSGGGSGGQSGGGSDTQGHYKYWIDYKFPPDANFGYSDGDFDTEEQALADFEQFLQDNRDAWGGTPYTDKLVSEYRVHRRNVDTGTDQILQDVRV